MIAGDPRIVQIDRFLSRDESYGLIARPDAYVSLHRSEGLGLGLARRWRSASRTSATAYSGNLEFMHEGNSLLVDYRLVPVMPGEYLVDDERFVWAEPDIEDRRRATMRRARRRPRAARALTAAGHTSIAHAHFTRERTATLMRERLDALGVTAAARAMPTGSLTGDASSCRTRRTARTHCSRSA